LIPALPSLETAALKSCKPCVIDGDTIEEAVNRGYGRVDINLAAPSSKWQV
jgi:hypothetical protein